MIETTVGEITAELPRRGLDPQDRVTVTIQPDELIPGRREARLRVIAAGLTDDDIDRLIDEARTEAQRLIDEGLTLFARTRRVPLAWLNGADMSEEKITLDFLAHQIRGLRDDVLSLKRRYGGSDRDGGPPTIKEFSRFKREA